MSEIKIIYKGKREILQYQPNEKLEKIFQRFKIKINFENKEELVYLYEGKKIEDKDIFISELTSNKDITILAYDINNIPTNIKKLVKSDYVICPNCKESAILEEKDYKFNIYGCENKHITKNILINQFNKLQEIDYSKIICQKCEQKRSESFNNDFNYCCECKISLCPLCKCTHDNNHNLINYNDIWYKCNIHNEKYYCYCNKCRRNICMKCENNHKEHKLIYYGKLIIEDNKIKRFMEEIKKEIELFNNDIKEIINKYNKIIEYMEEYYNVIDGVIKNYINNKNINYQILININNIVNNNNIFNDIKRINKNRNKYYDLFIIYNKIYNDKRNNKNDINKRNNDNKNSSINNKNNHISNKNNDNRNSCINNKNNHISNKNNDNKNSCINNENNDKINKNNDTNNKINDANNKKNVSSNKNNDKNNINNNENIIIYKINENEDKIKIFGKEFVDKNKSTIKIEIEANEYELMEYYKLNKNSNKNLEIKIKEIENIIDMSYMFFKCSSLSNINNISKWSSNNVTDMSYMFYGCSSLSSLPDISKWNTNNVTNMSYMFFGCSSLSSLPDISKWNTCNVINMSYIFDGCSSLSNLPDISKWNTDNVTNMTGMFSECSSLSNLPDISKWNTYKVTSMTGMFYGCSKLTNIPDISKWNISNISDMSSMFDGCLLLSNLPDISKWRINNASDMKYLTYGCYSENEIIINIDNNEKVINLDDLFIIENKINDIISTFNNKNNIHDLEVCNECIELINSYSKSSLKGMISAFFKDEIKLIINSSINLFIFFICILYHLSNNNIIIYDDLFATINNILNLLKINLALYSKKIQLYYEMKLGKTNFKYFKSFNNFLNKLNISEIVKEDDIVDIIEKNCVLITNDMKTIINYYSMNLDFYDFFVEIFNNLSFLKETDLLLYFDIQIKKLSIS